MTWKTMFSWDINHPQKKYLSATWIISNLKRLVHQRVCPNLSGAFNNGTRVLIRWKSLQKQGFAQKGGAQHPSCYWMTLPAILTDTKPLPCSTIFLVCPVHSYYMLNLFDLIITKNIYAVGSSSGLIKAHQAYAYGPITIEFEFQLIDQMSKPLSSISQNVKDQMLHLSGETSCCE